MKRTGERTLTRPTLHPSRPTPRPQMSLTPDQLGQLLRRVDEPRPTVRNLQLTEELAELCR